MYTRRYYRKTPPNYGGVTFSMPREASFVSETEASILKGQQDERASFLSTWQDGGREHTPATLSPLVGESGVWFCLEEASPSEEKKEESAFMGESAEGKAAFSFSSEEDGKGELILLGVLLFLLGSGIDTESLSLLFMLLILLT